MTSRKFIPKIMTSSLSYDIRLVIFVITASSYFIHADNDERYLINPKDNLPILVKVGLGTTNEKDEYEIGRLSTDYYFEIGGKLVNSESIKGLQTDIQATSTNYEFVENEKVLFRCTKKFKIAGKPCPRGVLMEGKVVQPKGDLKGVLGFDCRWYKPDKKIFDLIKLRKKEIYRFNSSKTRETFEDEICDGDKMVKGVYFELQPGCPFYGKNLIYPHQSHVRLRIDESDKSIDLRTDILASTKYAPESATRLPPIVSDTQPLVEDLEIGMEVLIATHQNPQKIGQKILWKVAILKNATRVTDDGEVKYEIEVATKLGELNRLPLDEVRILRGRVLNFCESVDALRIKGQSA